LTNARGGSNLSTPNPTREVLNCLRVLGRILPVVYEGETENAKDQDYRDVDGDPPFGQDQSQDQEGQESEGGMGFGGVDDRRVREHFAWHVLWKRPLAPRNPDPDHLQGQDGLNSGRPEGRDASISTPSDPLRQAADQAEKRNSRGEEKEEEERLPSLTDKLFGVTVDLLFCAGFTIPESMKGVDGQGDKINVGCSPSLLAGGGRKLHHKGQH
jgi:hypothetical protein